MLKKIKKEKKYYCCENCKLENFFKCKNCGIEHGHYIKDWLYGGNEFYICAFCKIETPIKKEPEQIKLL